ncbi:integral membrane protein [Pyrenophora tritici-repentis Pt-1C-BFP]|uniref:Integral membrane protein n=1 Tax=Pyrenophora tritici-repentis (strain Pt-1C-BFP) TaxID=426418 RepID=B2WBD1_PYRTR|nr:uncharacterized protein PTRG_06943 [Pyrenophora tritici-repentis Pt-1C-BFP]EDU49863.1 integral membrane protein [Pyrenophora tritici-repentis Pt-1C-BFP]
MQLPPLDVILSWPTPNYVDPETRGPALIIVNAIFMTLATLTVCARLYTRLVVKRWFGIDDVFILLALLFTVGLTAVVLLANERYGWDRWFKWLVHVNVAYTVSSFIALTVMAIFFCTPVENYWTIDAPADSCMDEAVLTMICGVINSVADLLTTLTPMPLVFRLQMPLNQRLAVAMLFGMGFIVTAAGIVRTWFIYRSLFNEWDQTWFTYPLWISAAVEIDLGVICASTPVLKPLFAKIPFSLSGSLQSGISVKRSAGNTTQTLTPSASTAYLSRRKSEPPLGAPELASDNGQSYEMKHWADAEAGLMRDDSERGSEGGILDEEPQPKKKTNRLFDKFRAKSTWWMLFLESLPLPSCYPAYSIYLPLQVPNNVNIFTSAKLQKKALGHPARYQACVAFSW